jgi:purine-nucleoside phosphorylase
MQYSSTEDHLGCVLIISFYDFLSDVCCFIVTAQLQIYRWAGQVNCSLSASSLVISIRFYARQGDLLQQIQNTGVVDLEFDNGKVYSEASGAAESSIGRFTVVLHCSYKYSL